MCPPSPRGPRAWPAAALPDRVLCPSVCPGVCALSTDTQRLVCRPWGAPEPPLPNPLESSADSAIFLFKKFNFFVQGEKNAITGFRRVLVGQSKCAGPGATEGPGAVSGPACGHCSRLHAPGRTCARGCSLSHPLPSCSSSFFVTSLGPVTVPSRLTVLLTWDQSHLDRSPRSLARAQCGSRQ